MAETAFDRDAETVGNIVNLGHVNTQIPDQQAATSFYVSGLGLTRDPYLMTGIDNMWVNVGVSQFHLFTGPAQVLRGVTGLVVPDLEALLGRLAAVRGRLEGSRFEFSEADGVVRTVCPWGNRIHCHGPDRERFGRTVLGLAYVDFDVRLGALDGIVRFYRQVLDAPAGITEDAGGRHAWVQAGMRQHLRFREADRPQPDFDGHHVQIYVTDFGGVYARLQALGLVTAESNRHQYFFQDIIDIDSREGLFRIDHEVRSLGHPMYGRPLVNRNPAQLGRTYKPGHDALPWSEAP